MLDFGFSEILLTSAIALVVLGPERLPKVARQVGTWMGRARVMARQLSEQLEREVNAEELVREQKKIAAMLDQPVIKPGELDALISGTPAAPAAPTAPTAPTAGAPAGELDALIRGTSGAAGPSSPTAPADSPSFPASGSPATASAPPPAAAPPESTRTVQ
jgi:sec-independent protein translocase protein TatB